MSYEDAQLAKNQKQSNLAYLLLDRLISGSELYFFQVICRPPMTHASFLNLPAFYLSGFQLPHPMFSFFQTSFRSSCISCHRWLYHDQIPGLSLISYRSILKLIPCIKGVSKYHVVVGYLVSCDDMFDLSHACLGKITAMLTKI